MKKNQLDPIAKEQFEKIPEAIQKIITDSNWEEKVRTIVKKNNLRIDQGAIIESEIFLVMLGFDSPDKFVQNLINEANLNQEQAEKIEDEVAEIIFDPIREILMNKTQKENGEEEEKEESQIKIPAPETMPESQIEESKESNLSNQENIIINTEEDDLDEILESKEQILKEIEDENNNIDETNNIVADNLTNTINTQEKNPEVKSENHIKKLNDPYREPIE